MTVFTASEEIPIEEQFLHGKIYFTMPDALGAAGAEVSRSAVDFEPYVVEDRELITGKSAVRPSHRGKADRSARARHCGGVSVYSNVIPARCAIAHRGREKSGRKRASAASGFFRTAFRETNRSSAASAARRCRSSPPDISRRNRENSTWRGCSSSSGGTGNSCRTASPCRRS